MEHMMVNKAAADDDNLMTSSSIINAIIKILCVPFKTLLLKLKK